MLPKSVESAVTVTQPLFRTLFGVQAVSETSFPAFNQTRQIDWLKRRGYGVRLVERPARWYSGGLSPVSGGAPIQPRLTKVRCGDFLARSADNVLGALGKCPKHSSARPSVSYFLLNAFRGAFTHLKADAFDSSLKTPLAQALSTPPTIPAFRVPCTFTPETKDSGRNVHKHDAKSEKKRFFALVSHRMYTGNAY